MNLTNEQWDRVKKIIPPANRELGGRGRPPQSSRNVLNGICWVLISGISWKDLPGRYPPHTTCHRYFKNWIEQGVFVKILSELSKDLRSRGKVDIQIEFNGNSFQIFNNLAALQQRVALETGPKSWQTRTLMLFNSPITCKAFMKK